MAFDPLKEIQNLERLQALAASNEDGAFDLFTDRLLFKEFAYGGFSATSNSSLILPLRDFQIFENYLYGRINIDFHAIHPVKQNLFSFGEENNFALLSTTLAFSSLVEDIRKDVASGKIPPDIPYISKMKAYKSFEDINVEYNKWSSTAIKETFSSYVKKFSNSAEIKDFKSFMVIFKEHLKMIAQQLGSVTYSTFCTSRRSNIRNSGLCVEIADLDFSKDSDKIIFSQDPYFSYYIKKAQKFGFFVDYNAPWRLIFNLSSTVNTEQASWSGLTLFFEENYDLSYNDDLAVIRNLSFSTYREYVNEFPRTRTQKVDKTTGCLVQSQISREQISKTEFDKKYPIEYWMGLYIDLKNEEKNLDFNRVEIEKIKNKALDYKKYVDIHRAMSYINNTFQDIPSVEGSYYSLLNKQFYRDQDPLPFEDFDKFIREVVKSYKQK